MAQLSREYYQYTHKKNLGSVNSLKKVIPELSDSNLIIEKVVDGLDTPTTMAFLGPNDFLVLEKDKGTCSESNQWQVARQTNTGCKRS